jgi:hypothetical protein
MQTEQAADTKVVTPDTKPMESAGNDLIAQAKALTITSNDDAQRAGAMLVDVKTLVKKIQGEFADPKKKAHEAHKSITSLESRMLEAPQSAEKIIKTALGEWEMKERRRIAEEERLMREEARKREEEARLAEAIELEQAGEPEMAAAVIEAPVIAPVVRIERPKVAGVSTRMRNVYRVVDPAKVNRAYLMLDETKIRKIVEASGKDAESIVGGIVVEQIPEVSARGR